MLDEETTTPDQPTNTADQASPASAEATDPVTGADAPAAKKTAKKAAAKKTAKKAATKKTTAKKTAKKAAPAADEAPETPVVDASATDEAAPKKKAAKKAASRPRKAAASAEAAAPETVESTEAAEATDQGAPGAPMVLFQAPEKTKPTRKRATKKAAAPADAPEAVSGPVSGAAAETAAEDAEKTEDAERTGGAAKRDRPAKKSARRPAKKAAAAPDDADEDDDETAAAADGADAADSESGEGESGEGGARRRRRRGGRRRRRGAGDGTGDDNESESSDDAEAAAEPESEDDGEGEGGNRRRRTRVRKPRNPEDEITSIGGSTRLEAKKQRRREGREAGRRRAPIVSEAEFLARREAVDRIMVIRQRDDLTQIAVLEDKVLVEHYVARESQTSLIGNIYLGRVQNVLPSMEAAFIDIGKGRNAVLYAGEVNWGALGHKDGQTRKVESVLKSGQTILVQVTKDPVGHKGARLTGQISLPGRFLVYVPDGNTSGISRKLPDTERNRLKTLLKEIVPDTAGVIVRTAAEGASEEELTQDVERLTARWSEIEKKVAAGKSPDLLYGEPDLTLKVVRDLFTEDFSKLVVQGDGAWDLVEQYVANVAPDLSERLERYDAGQQGKDVFAAYRLDEQISKGLDRKVWLPSGGSLVIDRTEAMTVVDVNTGKFTGSGGNLEETVTKNNLEAAEEMVRQLRLRDIGGIIVIDFIDMVLESNRDLVLRRLVECLGRDRTRHQVAEVTSLGLVQMTRKRIGTGLIEAFSEDCDHCKGRGIIVHDHPIEASNKSVGMGGGMGGGGDDSRAGGGRRTRGGRGRKGGDAAPVVESKPSPMALAGTKPHPADDEEQPETAAGAFETPTDVPVETTAPEKSDVAAVDKGADPDAAGKGAEAVSTETALETPEPVTGPVVVTSTRRRRAARPAGSQAAAAPAAVEPVAAEPAVAEPAAEAEPEIVETPAAPAAPVVVTTTRRRRAAGRPAGPAAVVEAPSDGVPAAVTDAAVTDAASAEAGESSEPTDDDSDAPAVFHVPVKKKGSRKR